MQVSQKNLFILIFKKNVDGKNSIIMKKILGIMVLSLLLSFNAYADWLVIVKNEIDKNVFIKRTKSTEENAIT